MNFVIDLLKKKVIGGNFFFVSCILCLKVYYLDECVEFFKKFLGERRDFIKEKGLCFGCYSFEYIVKFCRSRRFCKICNKKYLMLFYDYNWKLEEVNLEGRNV